MAFEYNNREELIDISGLGSAAMMESQAIAKIDSVERHFPIQGFRGCWPENICRTVCNLPQRNCVVNNTSTRRETSFPNY